MTKRAAKARLKVSDVFCANTVEMARDALTSILREVDPKAQQARLRAAEMVFHYALGKPVTAWSRDEVVRALNSVDDADVRSMSRGEVVDLLTKRIAGMLTFKDSVLVMSDDDWAATRKGKAA